MLGGMDNATSGFVRGLIVDELRVPPGLDWDDAVSATLRFRLGGVAWRLADGDGRVPGPVRDRWEAAHHAQALAGALLLDELADLRAVLRDAGIAAGVIKGVQLLEAGIHTLGSRAADDVDLIVPRTDARDAIHALREAGWVPWSTEAGEAPGWAAAATFEPRGPGRLAGLSVDLHWDTDYTALRGRETSDLPFDSRGWLPPERHLVLLVEHVLKHLRFRTHLVGLTDVVAVAAHVEDWDGFAVALRRSAWVRAATALLDGLGAETPRPLVPRGILPPAGRRLGRSLSLPSLVDGAGRPVGRIRGLGMRWAQLGPGRSIRDLREVLAPPADWLRVRYRRGRPGSARVRHLSRLVRWGLGSMSSPLTPNGDS